MKYFGVACLFGAMFFVSWSSVFASTAKDIANHQYRESIQYLYDHGVVEGYPDGTYKPDREVNRAEIMKIILQANLGDAVGSWSHCFPDVRDDRYAKYVCYAKEHAIVKWYTDGGFKPTQTVIFVEALKMALETFDVHVRSVSSSEKRYQGYLDFVHDNTIFSKYAYFPSKNITRGEMAYLIHTLMLNRAGTLSFNGVRNVRSPGCGKTAPSLPITSSFVNGVTRNYITEVGNKYSKDTPIKLILAFHGRTNSNEDVRRYYGINTPAKGNAIIVYPSGLPEEKGPRNRSNGSDKPSQLRDFALFDQIVKDFTDKYCIDMDQIFVVWHSLGAWFTNSLSCARGNVIRAIWSVGGGTTINNCNWPVAWMIMQNPDDHLSSYAVWLVARDQMLRQNWCTEENTPYGSVGNCVIYTNCLQDAPVIWCPYTESYNRNGSYYPHLWPDYAGKVIIDFFEGL